MRKSKVLISKRRNVEVIFTNFNSKCASTLALVTALIVFSACNENAADKVVGTSASVAASVTPDTSRAVLVTGISSASFPITSVNSSSSINVNVSNAGTAPAFLGITAFTGSYASITGDTCSSTMLAVGGFCSLTLDFSPTTVISTTEVLQIPYSGGGTFNFINSFSASSVAPDPSLISSPTSYDFGSVQIGSNGTHSFVISNSTLGAASVQAASIAGPGFSITADSCNGVVNMISGGATCTISVKFQPTVAGAVLSTLTLNYKNSSNTAFTKNISLSAIGSSPQPTLTLSPNPYNFASVPTGTNATQTITVSNASSASATLGTLTISGPGFTIASQTCNSTVLVPGAACQAILRFSQAVTGVASGAFTVPYTAVDGTPYSSAVTLGGTGVTPTTSFTFAGATGSSNLAATGVTVSWSAQTLAAYYVIRWTTGGTTSSSAHIAPTSIASYNITGLAPNTSYSIRVNAYDSSDNSDGNVATVSITTLNVTGATFNGWSDVVALGDVFTDIGTVDTTSGNTGTNRWDRNLGAVAGFDNTAINTSTNQITSTTTFGTGTAVTFRTDGTAPTGLTSGNTYYVINLSSTVMQLASTAANAAVGTAITLSTIGTGNMTLMPRSVVKLGWDLFTFTPSGAATSYNVYRDTSALFASPVLIGASNTNSFSDWVPTMQSTYYYKIKPVVSGLEVEPTAVNDSLIQVYVPPQNMSLIHRWIANREACTTLLGLTYSTGVNRNSNYSCSYAWGGSGATAFAPNTTRDKTKWDLGYSLIVDRWQNGCKMKTYGAGAPAGGATNDVYLKTGSSTTSVSSPANCYIKDSVLGWTYEADNITNASRALTRTNYPGYASTAATQAQTYASCQARTASGASDGNGNSGLRLMRLHEAVLARAVQGVNVNYRSSATLSNIFSGSSIPTYGGCNTPLNNSNGSTLNGVTIPNPSTYSLTINALMNGSNITRNCYSRYEISNLWDSNFEWLSTQYYGPATVGAGYFTASSVDAGENILEGFLMNGVVGNSIGQGLNLNTFGSINSTQNLMPLFGIQTVSTDPVLGSKNMTLANINFGTPPNSNYTPVSPSGSTNALFLGNIGSQGAGNHYWSTSRYSTAMTSLTSTNTGWSSYTPISSRCTGQVGP